MADDDRLAAALQEVTEERDRLRVAIDRSLDGVVIVSGDNRPSFVSAAIERMLGYAPESLIDADPFELLHPDSRAEMLASLAETEADGLAFPHTVTVRARHADGSWLWFEVSIANLVDDPTISAVVANVRDVTERRAAEAAIEAERARYLRLIEAIPDVVIRFDDAGRLTYRNPAADRFNPQNTTGVAEAEQTALERIRQVLADGQPQVFETSFTTDGVEVWYETVLVAELDGEGRTVGVTLVSRDVTERKRTEVELQQQVVTDSLTGVANRVRFQLELDRLLDGSQRSPGLVAVLYLDVDHFKQINDRWGHDVGDAFLVEVAATLSATVRASDVVARLGGDEFAIVLGELASVADAEHLAERMHEAVAAITIPGAGDLAGSLSIGLSYSDRWQQLPADELIRRADAAMYHAKRAGRHRTAVFTEE